MKKKAQKFSFIMMIIFFLTGIAMTIVAAVTMGTNFGTMSSSSSLWDYNGSSPQTVNPFAKFVFPTILCGLVGTFSITAIWWEVLEHFKNVEKSLDNIYRNNAGKEELPDSAYSYLPTIAENMANRPQMPAPQQPYQPYPPQYGQTGMMQPGQMGQPGQPIQPTQPAAPAAQPSADWVCPNCGTQNRADANFCLGCGHKKD